jgi:hypothetical protein
VEIARSEGSSVGVQDIDALTEGTERVTTKDLLTAVNDPAVTTRTLEYWRHEGLLPKAERTGQQGKRPEWTYPSETVDQLVALLRRRAKTKDPDLLRVCLWFDGYPIEVGLVRSSIATVLRGALDAMTKEIEKRREVVATGEDANWAVLEHVGRTLARKRGPNALPRYGRQPQAERERAVALALGLVLGDPGASARLEEDAPRVERMIGVDRGRRPHSGLPAWLDGPPDEGLQGFANFGSLPALIETMRTASDEELVASRGLARIVLDGMAAFARIADAFTGMDNPAGFGAISVFRDDPMAAVWLVSFVIAAARSSELSEGLRTVVESLSSQVLPVDARARELASLGDDELRIRLSDLGTLPFVEQVRLKRLIAEYRGELPPAVALGNPGGR